MALDPTISAQAKSWPFEEARKLAARYAKKPPEKGYVLFETGYGPSGLPHIGTFGEVARTTMVREAFKRISDIPTRLICFSDDMDGLRKVPDNLPNPDMIAANLGKPLTSIPDPFGTHESYGAHMNARLREFLIISVSSMSSKARPRRTRAASSTRRCWCCWSVTDK